jgi:hypothetical protein
VSEPEAVAAGPNTQVEFMIGSLPLAVLTRSAGLTTRWSRPANPVFGLGAKH